MTDQWDNADSPHSGEGKSKFKVGQGGHPRESGERKHISLEQLKKMDHDEDIRLSRLKKHEEGKKKKSI